MYYGKILVTVNSTKTNVHDVSFKLSFYDENNEFMRSFSDKIFGAIFEEYRKGLNK